MSFGKSKVSDKGRTPEPPGPSGNSSSQEPKKNVGASEEAIVPVESSAEGVALEEGIAAPVALEEGAAGIAEPSVSGAGDGEAKTKKLTEEKAQLLDQLLRKQAEFENFRKRTEKEKADFMRFANFEIVRDLLPILDGFERALKVETPEDQAGFRKGIELVYKQLYDALKKSGLAPIESQGQQFDPNFHQAVVHEERDDVEENVVIEEYQKGYMFQGRLLRAAMVKVASERKKVSGQPADEGEPEDF